MSVSDEYSDEPERPPICFHFNMLNGVRLGSRTLDMNGTTLGFLFSVSKVYLRASHCSQFKIVIGQNAYHGEIDMYKIFLKDDDLVSAIQGGPPSVMVQLVRVADLPMMRLGQPQHS